MMRGVIKKLKTCKQLFIMTETVVNAKFTKIGNLLEYILTKATVITYMHVSIIHQNSIILHS